MDNIDELSKIIWNYHNIRQELSHADLIFVLCSNDIRVAEYAAEIFLEGYAPRIIFSGGMAHQGDVLATGWDVPEADKFAEAAIKRGVLKEKILIENKAQNTGENFSFSKDILEKSGVSYRKIILVQKPFMLRRTYATFMKQWPGEKSEIILTSPPIDFANYPNELITEEILINTMVGDLQRISIYPKKGFQIEQNIPENVWQAFEKLVDLGYYKHLIRE